MMTNQDPQEDPNGLTNYQAKDPLTYHDLIWNVKLSHTYHTSPKQDPGSGIRVLQDR